MTRKVCKHHFIEKSVRVSLEWQENPTDEKFGLASYGWKFGLQENDDIHENVFCFYLQNYVHQPYVYATAPPIHALSR